MSCQCAPLSVERQMLSPGDLRLMLDHERAGPLRIETNTLVCGGCPYIGSDVRPLFADGVELEQRLFTLSRASIIARNLRACCVQAVALEDMEHSSRRLVAQVIIMAPSIDSLIRRRDQSRCMT